MTSHSLSSETVQRIGRLIALLASDQDGEVMAAVQAVRRLITKNGYDFNDLSRLIVSALNSEIAGRSSRLECAPSWGELLAFCLADRSILRLAEIEFLESMVSWCQRREPTDNQADWISNIYTRLKNRHHAGTSA